MPKAFLTIVLLACAAMAATAQRWYPATIPAPYNAGFYLDVYFLPSNPSYGWACDNNFGYVVRTTDGGRTWRGTQIQGAGCHLEYIQFLDTQTGYCSGPCGIYKSTDGGASWSADLRPTNPDRPAIWGGWFRDANTGWFVGGGCGTKVFLRTDDGGATFNRFESTVGGQGAPSDPLWQPDMPPNHVYAIAGGMMWRSVDDGFTWAPLLATGPTRPWHEELARFGSSWLIPSSETQCDAASTNGMRFSPDDGATIRQFNTNGAMFGSFLLDANTGWGAGFNWNVWYTQDAGQNWQRRACGIPAGTDLDDIWMIDANRGWVAGGRAGLYYLGPPSATVNKRDIMHIDRCLGREYLDTILVTNVNFTTATASAAISGRDANQFRIVQDIPPTIPTCTTVPVVVAYTPTRQGPHIASLTLSLQNPDTTVVVSLSGETRDRTARLTSDTITFTVRSGARDARAVEFVPTGTPYESVLTIDQLTGNGEIILVPRTPLPNQIGPGPLTLIAEATIRDTGTYEATFRVRLGPCLRDTIIVVRVRAITPIIKTISTASAALDCIATDTIRIPVSNTGNDVLRFGRILIGGQGASAFTPLFWTSGEALPGTIPAKRSDTLVVRVRPFQGDERATLTFEHDDWSAAFGSRNPWTIELQATSSIPRVRFSPTPLSFDTVCVGSTAERILSAANIGSTQASVRILHQPPGITGLPTSTVDVAPQLTRRWTLAIRPSQAGIIDDSIVVQVLPCDSVYVIPVRAVVLQGSIAFTPRSIDTVLPAGVSVADFLASISAVNGGPFTVRSVRLDPPTPLLRITQPGTPFVLDSTQTVGLEWRGGTDADSYQGLLIAESNAPCSPTDTIMLRIRQVPQNAIVIDAPDVNAEFRCGDSVASFSIVVANRGAEDVWVEQWQVDSSITLDRATINPIRIAAGGTASVPATSTRRPPAVDTIRLVARVDNRTTNVTVVVRAVDLDTKLEVDLATASLVEVDRCQAPIEWLVGLRNDGTIAADVSATLSPSVAGMAVDDAPQRLLPGQTGTVRVVALPASLPEGLAQTTLRITDATCTRTYDVDLATLTTGGVLSVSPEAVDVGNVVANTEQRAVILVENRSTASRTLRSVTLQNDGGVWSLVRIPPANRVMEPADVDTVVVAWQANATVRHTATVVLDDVGTCDVVHRVPVTGSTNVEGPVLLSVPLAYDDHTAQPSTMLDVPLRLTANVSEAAVDSMEVITVFSPLVYHVTEVLPGNLAGVTVTAQIQPGRVTIQAVRTDGGTFDTPGDVAILRGEARAAMPSSTALTMPRVLLRSTKNVTPQTQNGSIDVERCAKQFGIALGGLAGIRQVDPVPARTGVEVEVTAHDADVVLLDLVDSQGRVVATRTDVHVDAGTTVVSVDAADVGSGAYVVRCSGRSGRVATARVLVVR